MKDHTVALHWQTPPLSGNRTRGNPIVRAREVEAAKQAARIDIRAAKLKPMTGAEVYLHYRPKNRQRRDADNLAPTLKVCQDALVLEGLLPDDSWVCVPRCGMEIHEPTDEPPAMWLLIRELEAGE